jgi:adenine-specific DNA methylase
MKSGRAGGGPAPRTPTIRAKELFDRTGAAGFHDPFAGGGALPLEAQRLGLESYASDLNPVAVLINKAMIEIPPKFAGKPPVNPDRAAKTGRPGLPRPAGKARRAWPRTCATTASGCATKPRSASATFTPRSR